MPSGGRRNSPGSACAGGAAAPGVFKKPRCSERIAAVSGKNDGPLDGVLQLADIAGPAVTREQPAWHRR